MTLEANYRRDKLVRLARLGLVFAAVGLWMAFQPSGSFDDTRKIRSLAALLGAERDTVGHAVGWLCALMGIGIQPIAFKQMRFQGPAIRVNGEGIYYHGWSPKPISWDNVAKINIFGVYGQKMICLKLRDPSLNLSTTFLGKTARLNRLLGYGEVSISPQDTDTSLDDLARAIFDHFDLHERTKHDVAPRPNASRSFGRRGSAS